MNTCFARSLGALCIQFDGVAYDVSAFGDLEKGRTGATARIKDGGGLFWKVQELPQSCTFWRR
jgi:hypothetical protein